MPSPANDNTPLSGKKARAWPAMTTAIRGGDILAARVLERFARIYEAAHGDPGAIPSSAGRFEEDQADLRLVNFLDGDGIADDDQDSDAIREGYQVDCHISYGPSPKLLKELGEENFRIKHRSRDQVVDGVVTKSFESWAEIRGTDGKWRRIYERVRRPRGPAQQDDSLIWTRRVHPSGKVGATHCPRAAEDRLIARDELKRLKDALGHDRFEALRLAAVDRSTAQEIGERHGKTYKRASALGSTLIMEAVSAANDNLKLAEAG